MEVGFYVIFKVPIPSPCELNDNTITAFIVHRGRGLPSLAPGELYWTEWRGSNVLGSTGHMDGYPPLCIVLASCKVHPIPDSPAPPNIAMKYAGKRLLPPSTS